MNKKLALFHIFLFTNVSLGIIIFVFWTSNLEWNNKIANIFFPFIVFIFSIFTIKYSKKHFEKKQKHKMTYSSILSFIVSGFYFLYYAFCLTFGFLFFLFSISEEQDKVLIQRISSPNEIRYCETFFYPVGAYSGGTGRIKTYCINKFFPLVRKEVYTESKSYFPYGDVTLPYNFVIWEDDKTILVYDSLKIDVSKTQFYIKNVIFNLIFPKSKKLS